MSPRAFPLLLSLLFLPGSCARETGGPYTDSAGEPPRLETSFEFEPYPGSQWYGPDGDAVPKESGVVNAITGPDHCEWQSGVMMHVGWPLGRDSETASETRQYLRDPEKVFPQKSLMTAFDGDAELPKGAEDTGYRTDFMELWIDPERDGAAFLVFADHAERWPRARALVACG